MNGAAANGHSAENSPDAGGAWEAVWRPAGILYLVAMLIALAVGLWPGSIRPSEDPYSLSGAPIVQVLMVAQVVFYMMVYPVIVLFRASGKGRWRWWPDAVVETLFWTFISVAFLVPAVWLSGSTVSDAIGGMAYVCGLWPMAWVCGSWLASRKLGCSAVVFVSIVTVLGLPWLWYVSVEFFSPAGWSEALWKLCPVMEVWDVSAPGGVRGDVSPSPVWAIVVWPATAAVMFALWALIPSGKRGQDSLFANKES